VVVLGDGCWSEAGDVGRTATGRAVVCVKAPGDFRLVWRVLDSSTHRLVGAVDRLYSAYFLREADGMGFAYWIGLRIDGVPLGAISDNFAASEEFRARYGRLDDEGFVHRVYANVLGRAPDPGGAAHWTDLLERGVITRGQLMVGFSQSTEFRTRTGTTGPPPGTLEMPTYRARLPAGWRSGIDEDPATTEGAGFWSSDRDVHGSILRDPIDPVGGSTAEAVIRRIVDGHRGISNLVALGEAEPLGYDVDGEEAWHAVATFREWPGNQTFSTHWVAFLHGGEDYITTFEGFDPLDAGELAAFESILRSFEFV
jgi:hypothetical protein